jgi:hypothetical protein
MNVNGYCLFVLLKVRVLCIVLADAERESALGSSLSSVVSPVYQWHNLVPFLPSSATASSSGVSNTYDTVQDITSVCATGTLNTCM